jgi:hypothetical protein
MSKAAIPAVERDTDTVPSAPKEFYVDPLLAESASAEAAEQSRVFAACLHGDYSELTKLPDPKRELLAWMVAPREPVRHQTFPDRGYPKDWAAPDAVPSVEELENMLDRPATAPAASETDAEDHDWPISLPDLGARGRPGEGVARDLLLDGQIVTVVGEEGEGKSTLAWQIACQLAAGQDIGGHFQVPEPVSPILIVDVEQSEEDAMILRDDMLVRGLKIDGVHWLNGQGRMFDTVEDQKWLTERVRALRPQVLILDTGTESVTKPREDDSVKPLFIRLFRYLKADGVRTVVMLAQPRKRSQDAPSSRKFDDLFGSRVWKGRSSAVLYLEQEWLTVWKQRGSYIRRRWGSTSGRLQRSDVGPTMILAPQPEDEAQAERRNMIVAAIGLNAGRLSKSSLIEDELHIPGHARAAWKRTVEDLEAEGQIEARGQYKKLFLTAD